MTEIVGVVSVQPSNIPLWFDIVGKWVAGGVGENLEKQCVWLWGESETTNREPCPPIKTTSVMLI